MNAEVRNVTIKATKIATATCVALGGVALIASGAALRAVAEGGKYLVDAVKKIVADDPQPKNAAAEAAAQAEEVPEEPVAPAADAQDEAPADEVTG